MMLIKNINYLKILFILKNGHDSINTGELAEETKINHKNIGRYLSVLEKLAYIEREINQEGKKRIIMNTITTKGENYKIPNSYLIFLELYYN